VFEFGSVKKFIHVVQTNSEVQPASYPMDTGDYFSGGESGKSVKLTTPFQIVSRSRNYGSIHPLPIRLYEVVLN
jgi:hypothetical protein